MIDIIFRYESDCLNDTMGAFNQRNYDLCTQNEYAF